MKSVKKKTFMDPLTHEGGMERSLEEAEHFEQEAKNWLLELPRPFRLDADVVASNRAPVSATLQAQRCELAIVANRMVLKIFMPYLRACVSNDANVPTPTPRRVVSSVVDAAHAIVHAVQLTQTIWRQTRPSAFAYYSFGRTLFDALVMTAAAVIIHPTGASAGVALTDLAAGLTIMKDTRSAFGRSCRESCSGGTVQEAVHIIDRLFARAQAARAGDAPLPAPLVSLSSSGAKRKRVQDADEGEDSYTFEGDFNFPYVGTGVTYVRPSDGYFTPSVSQAGDVMQSEPGLRTTFVVTSSSAYEGAPEAGPSGASPPILSSPKPRPRARPRTSSSTSRAQSRAANGHGAQPQARASVTPATTPVKLPLQEHPPPDGGVYPSLPDLLIADAREQQRQQPQTHVDGIASSFTATPVGSILQQALPQAMPPPITIAPASQSILSAPQPQVTDYEPPTHSMPAYPQPMPSHQQHYGPPSFPYGDYYGMQPYTPIPPPPPREHEQPFMMNGAQSKQWPAPPGPPPAPPPHIQPPQTHQQHQQQQSPIGVDTPQRWTYF